MTVGQQMDPWWEEILVRVGIGLLAAAAVLGYRLKKSLSP